MTAQELGGLVTLIGIGVTLVGLIAVHVLPTGLNPLRDPVSQYHLTRYRPWIAVSTISSGIAAIGAMVAISAMLGAGGAITCVLLGLFAASRILIPLIRMDAPGTRPTAGGRIHYVLAFVAFGAATAAGFVAGGALHDGGYPDAATWSTNFGILMAIGAVGLLVTALRPGLRLFGLAERLIYVGFIAWFLLIGATAISQ